MADTITLVKTDMARFAAGQFYAEVSRDRSAIELFRIRPYRESPAAPDWSSEPTVSTKLSVEDAVALCAVLQAASHWLAANPGYKPLLVPETS